MFNSEKMLWRNNAFRQLARETDAISMSFCEFHACKYATYPSRKICQ